MKALDIFYLTQNSSEDAAVVDIVGGMTERVSSQEIGCKEKRLRNDLFCVE